jgi:hypothetical protein
MAIIFFSDSLSRIAAAPIPGFANAAHTAVGGGVVSGVRWAAKVSPLPRRLMMMLRCNNKRTPGG